MAARLMQSPRQRPTHHPAAKLEQICMTELLANAVFDLAETRALMRISAERGRKMPPVGTGTWGKRIMEYEPGKLSPRDSYKVLTSFVLPRPIAWVTSVGPTGVVNAAPFSFFNVFCENPPLCMFAVNKRPDGRMKDTLTNIQRTGVFVVNIADEPLARAMHETSGDFPPEIGEPGYLGLKLAPSSKIAVPRLADPPWAME
jgi:flavin reductase (DIM6/NTAB) family NADH-FMN oxidoreductase RutF